MDRFTVEIDFDNTIEDIVDHKMMNHIDFPTFLQLANDLDEECVITHEKNIRLKKEKTNVEAVLRDFMDICNRLQANPTDERILGVVRDMLQNMDVELK